MSEEKRPGAWNRFWFSRFDPVSLCLSRILIGSLMVVYYLALLPNWTRYYGPDGIRSVGDPAHGLTRSDPWSLFHWTESWLPVGLLWFVGIFAAICFTLGWKTRLFTVVLWVMESSMLHVAPQVMNGENVLLRMYLFYSMFAPNGYSLSVDSRLRKRALTAETRQADRRGPVAASSETLPLIWSTRALQIGLVLIYAISLPNKLADDVAWLTGDALYLAVVSNLWSRFPWPELFYSWHGVVGKIFTYGTLAIEGAFPLLVWWKRARCWVLFPLIALHLGIALVLMNVTFFTLSIACALWVFVPPELSWKIVRRFLSLRESRQPCDDATAEATRKVA